MERKSCNLSFVLFVTLLYVYCTVDVVVASDVTTERALSDKAYPTAHFTKTMAESTVYDTSSSTGRSIQEQGDVGPLSADVCADIIGPNWNKKKQAKSPCPTLVVWVPKKSGFTEFVKVNENGEVEGGFSVAIFCYSLQLLPYNVQPIFKPFVNDKGASNGTYDQLLKHIKGKTCEAVVGDVTIRGNRAEYVSFTIPYMSSEVYMLVRATHEWNQNLWTFIRPFTTSLWLALLGTYFLIGVALSFLEFREHNPEFASPFCRQLIMVIWFPISAFFFHEGRIYNRCSKVVLVMWFSIIFIVLQIFTATLSSWLTLDQLCPRLPSKFEIVGYPDGSFIKELIIEQYNSSEKSLLALNTMEEYKHVLSNGSVNVIFDELPYIELFLSKHGSEYMKFGPIHQESGIAFAFPLESPLTEIFSRAVINVTESKNMTEMKKKYLGFPNLETSQSNQALPQSLNIQSFVGLFIFMGTVIVAAIISSEIAIMRRRNEFGVAQERQEEGHDISVENFLIFMTVALLVAIMSSDISLMRRNNIPEEEG